MRSKLLLLFFLIDTQVPAQKVGKNIKKMIKFKLGKGGNVKEAGTIKIQK